MGFYALPRRLILLARAKTGNLPKREFKAKTGNLPKREFKAKTGNLPPSGLRSKKREFEFAKRHFFFGKPFLNLQYKCR